MKISSCLYLGAISLFGAAAAAQTNQQVFINGVALQATTSTKNGETYYQFKASDLKRAGAITAGGVKPKTDAIKGCVGDTLFNGVYSVQLIKFGMDGDRFGVTLKLSNASKQELHNFMAFSPSDVVVATNDSAAPLNNYKNQWIETLLPGTSMTLQTETDNRGTATKWTRLLIRPSADAVKELQKAKLPLAQIYNMEFDLICNKK
ncbi:hypothetical protein EHF33_02205 [Deinococcus psychrotolerans]|uniref:DUF4450 domain-containing protein n=1 Tax=Deinococcus psychrotolerans TaxID=2489213 RepID=A0A3G8YGM1_9DEIO|nr:hypothetical protein [Deinococcus psychrotolerans]AZI41704.1 hypothetical protein EHF33_02205 [Deinococcus psychrotolerans]